MNNILPLTIGYVMGSISFTAITAKMFNVNLSQIGSKNLGATNLSRAVGWKVAIFPAILDAVKTIFTFLVCIYLLKTNAETAMLAGVLTVLGHIYPFWNKFKGGKGVASMIGYAFCTQVFWIPLALCGVMIIINKKLKLMVLATLIVTTSFVISSYFSSSSIIFNYTKGLAFYYTLFLWCVIMWKHKANFKRWMFGQENSSGKN